MNVRIGAGHSVRQDFAETHLPAWATPSTGGSAWADCSASTTRPRRRRDGLSEPHTKLDADPNGGLSIDENFFPHGEEFKGRRVHQIRLQGGDASSDSYCYR